MEQLVILLVLIVLAIAVTPLAHKYLVADHISQPLSNMKQLHLATRQMALDGITTGNTLYGWPGDTGGTFSNWTSNLISGGYLSKRDLCKLLSAPGVSISPNDDLLQNHTAILLYTVRESTDGSGVFFTSANFINTPTGGILDPKAKSYGNKGFVVFRKGGDGATFQPHQVDQTNLIGSYVPLCK